MDTKRREPINILYVDGDGTFHELVSIALPNYGDFSVFTAFSIPTAVSILSEEEIDCIVLTDSLPEKSENELRKVLNEHGNATASRVTTDTSRGETSSKTDRDHQGSIVTEQFGELVARIEILVGKPCVGYSLQNRSYSIKTVGQRSRGIAGTIHDDTAGRNDKSSADDHDETPLIALHEATTQLMEAETKDEILTIVLDAVDDILKLPAAAIYLWDKETGVLRPHAATDETEILFGELPRFTGPDSLAWDAFIEGDFRVHENVKCNQNRYNSETVIASELFAPLGEHGLLISGAKKSDAISSVDIKATQTLATNAVTALDLVERKRRLTHQQKQLEEQNEQLAALKRINSVIRDVGRITVTASTQSEIERTICEKLTRIEPYCFAWFGEYEHNKGLQARQWSGTNGEFLDHLRESAESPSEQVLPANRALSTEEIQVTNDIFSDESFAPWRKAALNRGFQSAISLPLSYRQTKYGVLEIYASQPNAFGSEEQSAFAELGDIIANAFNTIERKLALLSDIQTELELRMSGQDDVFSRTARETNGEIELDTVVSRDDGTWLIYLNAVKEDPSVILPVVRGFSVVESAQLINDRGGTALFGIVLREFELGELLAAHGVKIKNIRASSDETSLIVSIPEKADVRTIVNTCQNRYPDVELVRRNSSVDSEALENKMEEVESLTEKQHEALEVALKQGFFAWPRDRTGEEIAELLDVTPPTFHRHVRMGLEAVLQETIGRQLR